MSSIFVISIWLVTDLLVEGRSSKEDCNRLEALLILELVISVFLKFKERELVNFDVNSLESSSKKERFKEGISGKDNSGAFTDKVEVELLFEFVSLDFLSMEIEDDIEPLPKTLENFIIWIEEEVVGEGIGEEEEEEEEKEEEEEEEELVNWWLLKLLFFNSPSIERSCWVSVTYKICINLYKTINFSAFFIFMFKFTFSVGDGIAGKGRSVNPWWFLHFL